MPKYTFEDIAMNSTEKKKPVEDDKYTYLGLEHLDPGTLTVSRFGSDVAPKGEKLIMKKGDVLFGKRRAYQKKVAIAPFDGIFSAHGMVLRPKVNVVNAKFFPFFISSDYFLDKVIQISVGSLSPTVNWGTLKDVHFELPPLERQEEVADLLWAANEVKEAYQKLVELTDEFIKAQFIEITINCAKARIGDICNIKARIGWQGLTKKEFLETGEYRLITGVDFQDNKINFERCFFVTKERYEQDDNIKISVGDVLVTKDGTIGKVAIVDKMVMPATLNSGVFVVRDVKGLLDNWFLLHSLLSDEFKNFIDKIKTGATIAHLNQKAFVNFEIPLPSIELQKQFANIAKQADIAKFEIGLNIKNLDTLAKSLLKSSIHII